MLRCAGCGGLVKTPAGIAASSSLSTDFDEFEKYYLECGAGIWDMFWPPALVADSPRKSLLDVGCGYGFTVDLWRTVMSGAAAGCDIEEYAERGAQALGAAIYRGHLDECPELAGRQFDIVYACEVIEHVPDPDAFLAMLARRLAPGGVLALTTPNASFVRRDNEPATVFCALSPGLHNFLFTPDQLRHLIGRHGFAHIEVRAIGARLLAWASHTPLELSDDLPALRERYLNYLRSACGNSSGVLRNVMTYRLFRECVFAGAWSEAAEYRDAVVAWVKPAAADPEMPATWVDCLGNLLTIEEFSARAPYVLSAAMTALGRFEQAARNDPARAIIWFDAALDVLARMTRLSAIHAMESIHVGWTALWQRLPALTALQRWDPARDAVAAVARATLEPQPGFGFALAPHEPACRLLTDALAAQSRVGRWDDVAETADWLARLGERPVAQSSDSEAPDALSRCAPMVAAYYRARVARQRDHDGAAARAQLARMQELAAELGDDPDTMPIATTLLRWATQERWALSQKSRPGSSMSYSFTMRGK